jgi:hypothetical protein
MKNFIAFLFGVACGVWITVDVIHKVQTKRLIQLQRETITLQDELIEQLKTQNQ